MLDYTSIISMCKITIDNLNCYEKGEKKKLKVYIRGLDCALLTTNLHSLLQPKERRRSENMLKIYLTKEDVLPSISDHPDLKYWKKYWKQFVVLIYSYALGVDQNPIGKTWFQNPKKIIENLDWLIPVPSSMEEPREKVKKALKKLIEARNKKYETKELLNFFNDPLIEHIELYSEGFTLPFIKKIASHPKIKKIYLDNSFITEELDEKFEVSWNTNTRAYNQSIKIKSILRNSKHTYKNNRFIQNKE